MIATDQRQPTWQRLGTKVEGMSIEGAMATAGIDFEVGMVPLVASVPDPFVSAFAAEEMRVAKAVPRTSLTYRKDNGEPIAPVGNRYTVVQTREVIGFIEAMTGGGWRPEFAGVANRGRAVFMAGRMDLATSNEVDPYLCFVNSFDGSSGLKFACTPVRPACTNQIKAIFNRKARPVVSLRHTSNVLHRAEAVRDTLQLSQAYYKFLDEQIDRLLNVELTDERLEEVLNLVAPLTDETGNMLEGYRLDRRTDKRSEVMFNLHNSSTIPSEMKSTAWGIYNVMTEMEQWGKATVPTRSQSEQALGRHLGMVPMVTTSDRVLKVINDWCVPV